MTTKANMKLLKSALTQLEFAQGDLEDFVYYTNSDTCSNISPRIVTGKQIGRANV